MGSTDAPLLSVVIPARNEEGVLAATLDELEATLEQAGVPFELVLVNDNSTDHTHAILVERSARDRHVRLVEPGPPPGFGRAVRAGIEAVQGEVVVICMADRSDDPADVVAYYRKICEGYDCVFGSRFVPGAHVEKYPPLKRAVNRAVNKCVQALFRCPFNDLTNAFKAYRRDVIRTCGPYRSCHFNITIEMSLSALIRGFRIAQIPIRWYGRTWGSSHLSLREMGRRYLATLIKVAAERFLILDDVMAERRSAEARRRKERGRG